MLRFSFFACASLGAALLFAPVAAADCVDYSVARAKQAADALRKSPPKLVDLGVPDIVGLTVIPERSSGDPKCDGPQADRRTYWYTTNLSLQQVYEGVFAYVQPRDNWISPSGGDVHEFKLTSGTEVKLYCADPKCGGDPTAPGLIKELRISRASPGFAKPLAESGGPGWNWTAADMAKGLFQPSAGRATSFAGNGRAAAPMAVSPGSTTSAAATAPVQAPVNPNCPPAGSSVAKGVTTGGNIGAEIGGEVIGGGYGRYVGKNVGSVLGGLGGALGKKKPAEPAPGQACP